MTNTDWTKAPEGATHYDPNDMDIDTCWMKKDDQGWYCYDGNGKWVSCFSWVQENFPKQLIPRPIKTSDNRSESIIVKSETIITIQADCNHVDKVYVNGKLYAPVSDGEC